MPNLIVPPICVFDISGMNTTAGCGVFSSNSVEFAFSIPNTFLQNSIVAICNPKQTPRYGILFTLAYSAAFIFPSIPLIPKPPGTRIPSEFFRLFHASVYFSTLSFFIFSSKFSASIQLISSLRFTSNDECCSALMTLRYESESPVYLPTIAIFTTSSRLSTVSAIFIQSSSRGLESGKSKFISLESTLLTPCSSKRIGIRYMFDTS